MKLYEFSGFISVYTVIAAESEQDARAEIASWGKGAWLANGDAMDEVSDVELLDVRNARSDNLDDLKDEAHVVLWTEFARVITSPSGRTK